MRKVFYSGKGFRHIKKNKIRLERAFDVKLTVSSSDITVDSKKKDSVQEYLALEVIDALSLGFGIDAALQLRDEDFMFKKVNVKNYAKGTRISVIKGRIIGKEGRTKELIENLSETEIVVSEHLIGIIGRVEAVEVASQAIQSLIRGSPQSKVYAFLERSKKRLKVLSEEELKEMIKDKD